MHHYIELLHEIIANSVTAMVFMNKALDIRQRKHGKDHQDLVGKQQIIGCLKSL